MSSNRERSYTDIEAISNISDLKKKADISILMYYLTYFEFSRREQSYESVYQI